MTLLTNTSANRVIAEGLSNLNSLLDFDKDSLEALPRHVLERYLQLKLIQMMMLLQPMLFQQEMCPLPVYID